MRLPKILITTYHEAFLHRGGGEFEIAMISNALKKHGLVADNYGPYSQDISSYDAILHFSVEASGLNLLRQIKSAGKPIILSPNLFIKENNSTISALVSEFMDISDIIIFKSESEKKDFSRFFEAPSNKVRLVSQFVDNGIMKRAPEGLFSSLYGVQNYAIGVGIIEPGKNQLMAIKAANQLSLPLVLVGNYRDYDYYQACKNEAPSNTLFITSLPYHSEIMRSALQGSSLYIEVTPEPAGFSAIEAGLSGCSMVLADTEWSNEHFGDYANYVDPESVDSIKDGMSLALDSENVNDELPKRLKHHLSEQNINVLFDILLEASAVNE
ncbi:MAG: glycosyltransferase [Methylococcales bacterium]